MQATPKAPAAVAGPPWRPLSGPWGGLVDEAAARGLDHVNHSGRPGKPTVLEANGAGVALIDLECDGDLDVVFGQGLPSLEALVEGPGADLEVYLNDGAGNFTRAPGPGLSGWWIALAVGDVDGDGDQDLVAGGLGGLEVLLADEHGRLVRSPRGDLMPGAWARFRPGEPRNETRAPLWVNALALFDADRDGALDLYVGHYLDFDPRAPALGELGEGALAVPCRWKGAQVFCGPRGLIAQPDRLLRGRGDGTFEDRTSTWLGQVPPGYTLAVLPFDFDGDLDTDLYVACDSSANLLLVNDGRGRFTDVGFSAGVALSPEGAAEAGMGAAAADVDGNGWLDLAVTNFSGEPTALYLGGERGFRNETFRAGLNRESRDLLSWSVHLADLDGDSRPELFTANGHVYPQADLPDTGTRYGQAASLWRFDEEGRVVRIEPAGDDSILAPELGARGSALGDLDGDGAPDLVLDRIDGPVALGMNRRRGTAANWLVVRCLGPERGELVEGAAAGRTPADGMGARVLVVPAGAGAPTLTAEVQTAVGYASASSAWPCFALGESTSYASLEVRWPSGRVETLPGGPGGRRLTVREGNGIVAEEPLR
ncbi:MAG TPA: CRTAC1 family protein [Planctomycetota bacterium]|nr:CRTAC1 family protein [Planctomycetota bacterium]